MRNLSLLFLFVLLGCQSSKTSTTSNASTPAGSKTVAKVATQGNPFYKPFSEFKGDTLQYLNYNFVTHKAQYIGKPFLVLYHDLEIPVKSCSGSPDANNLLVSSSIDLSFYDDGTTRYRMNNDNLPSYFLIITWEKPLSAEPLFELYKASDGNWSPGHEAFVAGSIIKDVSVLKYIDPRSTMK